VLRKGKETQLTQSPQATGTHVNHIGINIGTAEIREFCFIP